MRRRRRWPGMRRSTDWPTPAGYCSTPMSLCSLIEDGMRQARVDRRSFLWQAGGGLGGIALAYLLQRDQLLAADVSAKRKQSLALHHRPRARRVVQLFMSGAASQVDTFDYKPELIKRHGQKFDPGGKVELFQSSPGACMKSPWTWKQYGRCGKHMSSLVPHLAECVDDMAFLHALVSKSN